MLQDGLRKQHFLYGISRFPMSGSYRRSLPSNKKLRGKPTTRSAGRQEPAEGATTPLAKDRHSPRQDWPSESLAEANGGAVASVVQIRAASPGWTANATAG
jgi:hypothetical protein